MITWIIGLSGSGKSTLASYISTELAAKQKPHIVLDGDVIRNIFDNDLGHTINDRSKNSLRIVRLSLFLESQGIDVICAILSIFPEHRDFLREKANKYIEVFIDTPTNELFKRDPKGIYSEYKSGNRKDVVGLDIEFPVPESPDIYILNDKDIASMYEQANMIVEEIA